MQLISANAPSLIRGRLHAMDLIPTGPPSRLEPSESRQPRTYGARRSTGNGTSLWTPAFCRAMCRAHYTASRGFGPVASLRKLLAEEPQRDLRVSLPEGDALRLDAHDGPAVDLVAHFRTNALARLVPLEQRNRALL